MSTTTQTSAKACVTCQHWNSKTNDKGECRRQPPQAISFKINDEVRFETRFPQTAASDWCGEYSAKA